MNTLFSNADSENKCRHTGCCKSCIEKNNCTNACPCCNSEKASSDSEEQQK